MELRTERLLLTTIDAVHLQDVHQLHSFPETDQYNTLGIPSDIEVTQSLLAEWIARQQTVPRSSYIFHVALIDSKQFVGLIALNIGKPTYHVAEVWYKTIPAFWQKGYTSEALQQILSFGFHQLKLHRIEAGCATENVASIKVLEKCGMLREGMKRKLLPIRGTWADNYFYAILETDFNREGMVEPYNDLKKS